MATGPRDCPRCKTKNSSTDDYCMRCMMPLNADELGVLVKEEETLGDSLPRLLRLLGDPEVAADVRRKARSNV